MSPRKSSKSTEETRTALLEAARHVFAEEGFTGARVERIAALAGSNKALINYHFGSKAELFRAVIEHFTGRLATRLRAVIDPDEPAEQQLRAFVRHMAATAAEHPEFPRLMLFNAQHADILPEPPGHFLLVLQTLGAILEKGRREGSFRPINLFFAHMHIMSSFAMYHLTRPLRERLRGKAPIPDVVFDTQAFNAFVEDQILAGFAARQAENKQAEP